MPIGSMLCGRRLVLCLARSSCPRASIWAGCWCAATRPAPRPSFPGGLVTSSCRFLVACAHAVVVLGSWGGRIWGVIGTHHDRLRVIQSIRVPTKVRRNGRRHRERLSYAPQNHRRLPARHPRHDCALSHGLPSLELISRLLSVEDRLHLQDLLPSSARHRDQQHALLGARGQKRGGQCWCSTCRWTRRPPADEWRL
jgi:hypothetical protein